MYSTDPKVIKSLESTGVLIKDEDKSLAKSIREALKRGEKLFLIRKPK